jgi:hypothetical protein
MLNRLFFFEIYLKCHLTLTDGQNPKECETTFGVAVPINFKINFYLFVYNFQILC